MIQKRCEVRRSERKEKKRGGRGGKLAWRTKIVKGTVKLQHVRDISTPYIQHRRTVERSNKLFSKVSTTSFGVAEGPTGTRKGRGG